MTERTQDNELFADLKRVINHVLPLEYAIRAVQLESPEQFRCLKVIDQNIRQHWLDVGAQAWMLESENLMDFAWDVIQVGIPLSRRHLRCYITPSVLVEQPDLPVLIERGLSDVREVFGAEVEAVRIPALDHFRICDLLNGNNILELLRAGAQCLNDASLYNKTDSINIGQMVRGVREPILLLPGGEYVSLHRDEGGQKIESFGMVLDLGRDVPIADLKRQVREFMYQLAVRKHEYGIRDRLADDLIADFLRDEHRGAVYGHKVLRFDGLLSALIGLYCWDLARQLESEGVKASVGVAQDLGLKVYVKHVREVGLEAIKKHYYAVEKAIRKKAVEMRNGAKR